MYKDAKEELKRLEDALLEEEDAGQEQESDIDALIAETRQLTGDYGEETRVFQWDPQQLEAPVRAFNTDRTDTDLDRFAQTVMEEPVKGLRGLTITAVVLAAAIVVVLATWLIRYGGAFL